MSESLKTLIIINQKAGKGNPGPALAKIVNCYSAHGEFPVVYLTQEKGDAFAKAKALASEYDKIVCYGGDGTLDEVSAGIAKSGSECIIGYIPAGSTNDFGNSLGLPTDVEKAAEITVSGQVFNCDIGVMNGKYFAYVAAFGSLAEVSYKTSQDLKNFLGHSAYLIEGAKRILTMKSYNLKVDMDDEHIEGDFISGIISNSSSVGGIKGLPGSNIELDDGVFEVVLVKKIRNPIDLERVLTNLMFQKSDELVYYRKVSKLVVEGEGVSWTLDGEDGGIHDRVEVINQRHGMKIMIPSAENKEITEG